MVDRILTTDEARNLRVQLLDALIDLSTSVRHGSTVEELDQEWSNAAQAMATLQKHVKAALENRVEGDGGMAEDITPPEWGS